MCVCVYYWYIDKLLACRVQAWLCLPWAVECIWWTLQHPAVYFLSKPGSSVLPERQLHVSRLHLGSVLTADQLTHARTFLLSVFSVLLFIGRCFLSFVIWECNFSSFPSLCLIYCLLFVCKMHQIVCCCCAGTVISCILCPHLITQLQWCQ